MALMEVEQTTRDERLAQETGPLLHVPGTPNGMFPPVRQCLVARPSETGTRMQPWANRPRLTKTRHQITWVHQRPPAQPHPQFFERHHRGVMHMLMRHRMVGRERSVKNAHPFGRNAPRCGRGCEEDIGRQRQGDKAPPKDFSTRFLAIDPQDHLPAVGLQQTPRGPHQTGHTSPRPVLTPSWPTPFLSGTVEWTLHRRWPQTQILPVYLGALANVRLNVAPDHSRPRFNEPCGHAKVRRNCVRVQPIAQRGRVNHHNSSSLCLRPVDSPLIDSRSLARIMREGAVEGETQEPPCGTNVVHTTF